MTTDNPQIYVASLADYNAGRLLGCWIELDTAPTADEISEQIQEMLKSSKEPVAEDWAIHDTDEIPSGLVGEFTSLAELERLGDAIAKHGLAAVDAAADIYPGDIEGCATLLENGWSEYEAGSSGGWSARAEYAYEFAEGMISDDNPLFGYVDWDRYGRDLLTDLTSTERNGTLYIFHD